MTSDKTDSLSESSVLTNDVADGCNEPDSGAAISIVGVGASAGGLEAFTALLKHLPHDTGMCFVLVQHLDPQHESALRQILARATAMPVGEVTDNLPVQANHVYVIPPNTSLSIVGGKLKLQPRPSAHTPHRSIDFFLESLAQDQRERAIGVILSGTATDGTLGLEAIRAEGGITFAQDESARYDSMPRSAAAAGCVDFVLSPENIAKELVRISKHPCVAGRPTEILTPAGVDRASATEHEDDATLLPSGGSGTPRTGATQAPAEAERARAKRAGENGFKRVLLLLRNHCRVDFELYKSTTIQRRVRRRMVLSKHETLESYADFLRGNVQELDALYSDALISVTSFFRNPEAFDVLKQTVFPSLLRQHGDDPCRMWVLGCSTGQEAYSIAMAFLEAAQKSRRTRTLQVFATDLNDALLEKARQGLYAKSLAADVSPQRLRRFFVEEEGGYRVIKSLREMVVFARQNLISDPPFSRMDLISCRNLLIYLESSLQKKVLRTFHYALKPQGFLFLGASESIAGFTELFEPADKKHKIYSKKAAPTAVYSLPIKNERRSAAPQPMGREPSGMQPDVPAALRGELNAQREADRVTVNQFAPPGVLINDELQILQFRGPTGAYLEPPSGKATFDVLKMAREGLMLPLRDSINIARQENRTARRENVRIEQHGQTRRVNLQVIPLKNLQERCYLILFEDAEKFSRATPETQASRSATAPGLSDDGLVEDTAESGGLRPPARQEPARQEAAASGEEVRRIDELETELAATRDYLQSIQEQYEAANEELQAANEEVQSANEELQSLNEELETSKEELESSNEELTTLNEEMANRNTEVNGLNSDLLNLQTSTRLAIVLLGRDLTIRRFSPQAEKKFNLLNADIGRPFSNVRHNLVFPDTPARGASEGSEATGELDPALARVPSFETASIKDTGSVGGAQPPEALETFIAEVIDTVRERDFEVRDKDGRWFSLRVRPYITLDKKVDGAVLMLVDIDVLKRSEQAIADARDLAENTIETVREPLIVLDGQLRVESANRAFYRNFQVAPAQTIGSSIFDLGNRQWNIPRLRTLLQDILPDSTTLDDFQVEHDFEQLGRRTMLLNARRMEDPARKTRRILLAIEDITERRQHQQELQNARDYAEAILRNARDPMLILDADLRVHSANEAFYSKFKVTAAESVGCLIHELGNRQWRIPRLRQLLEEILPRNSFFDNFEVTHNFEKIGHRLMLLHARKLTAVGDQPARILLGIQDITEVLQFQTETRENAEKFKLLFERSPLPKWAFEPETLRFVDVNEAAVRHYGYSHEEFLRMTVLDVCTPEAGAALQAALARPPHHPPERETCQHRKQNGDVLDVEVWSSEIALAGKRLWLSTINHVTERKLAADEVNEAERRLRFVMDSMPQKIFTAKPNGEVDYFNPQWTEFTSLSLEQIRDCGWTQFIHPDDVDKSVSVWQQAIDTDEPFHFEHRFRRADGAYRWHMSWALPMRDAQGRIVMWIGSNTDIHEQRQTTCGLRQLAADLVLRAAALNRDDPTAAKVAEERIALNPAGRDLFADKPIDEVLAGWFNVSQSSFVPSAVRP